MQKLLDPFLPSRNSPFCELARNLTKKDEHMKFCQWPHLLGKQTKTLKFQVNVSSPGIYCFQGAFRFQALDSERNAHEFSWDEAVLIPLQISFLLEDSSIVHT